MKCWGRESKGKPPTFLLIADEDLQGDSCFHFDRHLVVVDEAEASQLQGCLQILVTLELHLAEVMQHPTSLGKDKAISDTIWFLF